LVVGTCLCATAKFLGMVHFPSCVLATFQGELFAMLEYRFAQPVDMPSIVSLHVSLSQATYDHILPRGYLKDVLPQEKEELWAGRFAVPDPHLITVVATDRDEVIGFCCFPFAEEIQFGSYLHNLYVSSEYQGRGVARATLRWAIDMFDNERKALPVHLRVFSKNIRAVAMYERWGGQIIERSNVVRLGNPSVEIVRYQWPSAHELLIKLGKFPPG
jgi:ribosomal protein S18 acetylase RimI-like enzyme